MTRKTPKLNIGMQPHYDSVLGDVSRVIDTARVAAARSVNSIMTAAYWLVGRRVIELEQGGKTRASYGEDLLSKLSGDLTAQFGRGFAKSNLYQMRSFYLAYRDIFQTLSGKFDEKESSIAKAPEIEATESSLLELSRHFPLPWSAYIRLLSVKNENARQFYETETLRGGWSVRQLDRQINSKFFERVALSKNKVSMLQKGEQKLPEDHIRPEQEIKDPYVLEFLGLKDEYSETELEEALINHMETFLLELGGDFCFIGRQRRLRIDDEWFRVDLLFFHRRLRCLVIIDLKIGKFTPADAGQMHLYLNYAREHWMQEGENPPVGLILCDQKGDAVVRYALGGLPNKVMAAEYRTVLPEERRLVEEVRRVHRRVHRGLARSSSLR